MQVGDDLQSKPYKDWYSKFDLKMIIAGEFLVNNELERKNWEYLFIHLFPHGRKAVIANSLCFWRVQIGHREINQ